MLKIYMYISQALTFGRVHVKLSTLNVNIKQDYSESSFSFTPAYRLSS